MAELSPNKDGNPPGQLYVPKTPPGWKRPDEVLRKHRLSMKNKHLALQARMSNTHIYSQTSQLNVSVDSAVLHTKEKRKNPFRKFGSADLNDSASKKAKPQIFDDATSSSVFQFLRYDDTSLQNKSLTSFKNILNSSTTLEKIKVESNEATGSKDIPVDWKLRTKVRFMSLKPFPWNSKLKTCEEASGTSAFVRCLDTTSNNENCYLDTSANAQFHQRCLVWQHPHLPWIELYPRVSQPHSNLTSSVFAKQDIRDSMHTSWAESFRSVFQLLRAQQCPYFYILANTFTCLFRAAGICGHSELHALITPTTRGFRQALKAEDIEFTMPLKEGEKRRSFENQAESGYSTLDTSVGGDNSTLKEESLNNTTSDLTKCDEQDDELEDDEKWLESMGVDENEIKRISNSQSDVEFNKERKTDKTSESLVYVEGIEAQALFNFLMNCKSNTATTGPLAGIPPTILAPVAFHGATLRPLKLRQNIVNVNTDKYYSMEIRGPVLPHIIHSLAHLLKETSDTYSLTFASIESTSAFTLTHKTRCSENLTTKETEESAQNTPSKATRNITTFGQVNLSDCGLNQSILKNFCKSDVGDVQQYDSIKFSDGLFTWS